MVSISRCLQLSLSSLLSSCLGSAPCPAPWSSLRELTLTQSQVTSVIDKYLKVSVDHSLFSYFHTLSFSKFIILTGFMTIEPVLDLLYFTLTSLSPALSLYRTSLDLLYF